MKILLKEGKIYDGIGNKPYLGSILIEDDRILCVKDSIEEECADEVISLKGMSVSSGFIDAHSHNDWYAIKQNPLPYFEPFIRQGITTFITGNCGLSVAGFEKDCLYVKQLGGGLFSFHETTGKYGTISEFFDAIHKKIPGNLAILVGHCTVRNGLIGTSNQPLTLEEEQNMLFLLEEALKQGACGISLGLMYEPGLYADTLELKKVAKLCMKFNRPLTVHPRANSSVSMAYPQLFGRSHLLRALDELVEIAREMNDTKDEFSNEKNQFKLQYSHAIFVGRSSFRDKDEFLSIMHQLRNEGIDIGFDIYHEEMGVSVITVILPTWYQALSKRQRKRPWNKIKLWLLCKVTSKLLGFGFDDIEIAYIGKDGQEFEGKTVHQIARERNQSDLDTYLFLCEKSNFKGRVNMGPYSTKDIIYELAKENDCIYMTDAWVEEEGVQNPAIYDCFPKFLQSSLKNKTNTMEQTIRKMTGQVADRFSLKDRGYIKEGYFADITVFNEEILKNEPPDQNKSFGIEKVFINGKQVIEKDTMNEVLLQNAGYAIRS